MVDKLHFFQIGILILFGILAGIGVLIIATNRVDNTVLSLKAPIIIWGPPLSEFPMGVFFSEEAKENKLFEKVTYVEKNPISLYSELLEAISTGTGPDLVVLNSAGLLPLKNKLYPIPFETLPLASFRNEYVDGAEIFVFPEGVYALPLFVDPLVLYWNKDLYASEGVAQVPKDWDSVVQLIHRFSRVIEGGNLVQSAIALGEYDNVLHAKEILSTLYMQTGAKVVSRDDSNNFFASDLKSSDETNKYALALQFYTSFSNPNKAVYSWNKTFDRSREAFSANKVAMYIGPLSEEKVLPKINPNLNFDVALLPQLKNAHFSVTHGNFYGIGVLKTSLQPAQALYVAQVLTGSATAKKLSDLSGLPSVRRDVLTMQDVTDPFSITKAQSAIMARSWLEPAPQSEVMSMFKRAINNVVSGTVSPVMGTTQLGTDLDVLLQQYSDK